MPGKCPVIWKSMRIASGMVRDKESIRFVFAFAYLFCSKFSGFSKDIPYPARSTAFFIISTVTLSSLITKAVSVARLIEANVTPGIFSRALSFIFEQEAHVMPVIWKDRFVSTIFTTLRIIKQTIKVKKRYESSVKYTTMYKWNEKNKIMGVESMKKLTIRFFAFLILLAFTFSWFLSYPVISIAEEKDIFVETDLRIELLTIVQYLSDNPLLTKFDFPYKQEMLKKFLPFKSHFAVAKTKMLFDRGFSFDGPPGVMLHLSQPPELKVVVPFTPYLIGRADGEENLREFLDGLRVFVKETKFMQIMEQFKPYFKEIETQTKEKFNSKAYLKQLEDYYGYGQHSYHIILGSFIHCGGYGPSVQLQDGTFDVYSIIGPCDVKDDYPNFGGTEYFEELIFHEFSHSFINPLTEEHWKDFRDLEKLFTPISADMQNLAYGSWKTCINEHLGRVFTARIAFTNKGSDAWEKAMEEDIKLGFVYLPYLDALYQTYEKNRSEYPTIRSFYSEIAKLFKKLTTYPAIPTKFKIVTSGIKGVSLEWKDNARDEEGYRIYRSQQKREGYTLLVELPKSSKEFDDLTIEPGNTYWYKLIAFGQNGEIEVYPISCRIPFSAPVEPTNFHLISVIGQKVSLGWDYKSKCSGFALFEGPEEKEIQQIQGDLRSIELPLVPFGEHTYMLKSYNQYEDEKKFCAKVTKITLPVLQPPGNLKAKALGVSSIELTWEFLETVSDKVVIYRKTGLEDFALLVEIQRNQKYIDEKLEPDKEYEYKIYSKKGMNVQSDDSVVVKGKTEPKKEPEKPKDIVIKLKLGEQGSLMKDGRVFVPLRWTAEAFGARVDWIGSEQKIVIILEETSLELWIGKNIAQINGVKRLIDPNNPKIMPIIVSGRTFVPLRFVGEGLGCSVNWDGKTQEITIIYVFSAK